MTQTTMVATESDSPGVSMQATHPFPTSHTTSSRTTVEARVAYGILMLCDRIAAELSRVRGLRSNGVITKKELIELENDIVKEIDTWAT